ncbi:MAG TPA: cyclic nucleotide-binding domain-containing protein, partial [Actinomycetota bacterium]|nr:cyclic nucleotide-binding domain-containing protein [Actinomycetota bacterium]
RHLTQREHALHDRQRRERLHVPSPSFRGSRGGLAHQRIRIARRRRDRVADAATEHVYPDGTVIAERGDPGDAMHVVVAGKVRVLVDEDGRLVEVASRGPGYIVGEMAVLTDEPRMASLVAAGDVRTLSLDRARFQRILRERPDAAAAVMRELCARLRDVHEHREFEVPR